MNHDVFISHSAKDKPIADAVCATLEAKGIRCWIAPRDILPGSDYGEAIIDAITQCRFMVLVFSTNANESRQIIIEVERAVNKGVVIIPFRVEDVTPSKSLEYFLSAPHWLDALTPPLEKHIEYLAETVLLLKSQQEPERTPRAPAEQSTSTTSPLQKAGVAEKRVTNQASNQNIDQPISDLTFNALISNPGRLVNQRLGSYVLREVIGMGGSGIVYKALNPKLGKESCVKVFYPLTLEAASVAQVIHRGVRGVAALDHPYIIKLFDFSTLELADGASFYLVMEYVQGRPLSYWAGGRSVNEALVMAYQIAEALKAAHQCDYFDEVGFEQRGVLHGDIKPENILVRPNNTPVLLDFMMVDVQRLLDRSMVPNSSPDVDTSAYGTANYMAHEQEAQGIVTVKSDIFSLGRTFYDLFFPNNFLNMVRLAPSDVDLGPDKPSAAIRELLGRMMHFEPSERPQDMSEVVAALGAELKKAASIKPRVVSISKSEYAESIGQTSFSSGATQPETEADFADTLSGETIDEDGPTLPLIAPTSLSSGDFQTEFASKPSTPLILDENVQFTVYRPKAVLPQKWYSLLAFAHLSERPDDAGRDEPDPVEEVRSQAQRMLGEQADDYQNLTQDTLQAIPREGTITFMPTMPGVEFNPPSRSFVWEESVHREDFRFRAGPDLDGRVVKGRLSVFLGSILLADIPLSIRVDSTQVTTRQEPSLEESYARPYRKIFASYSHQDKGVVEQFGEYLEALGDRYLRDVTYLRSGERWSERLEVMIHEADIFQLFWSSNSMNSEFVKREWEYALSLNRANFVRPTYWEDTLPTKPERNLPPEELMRLHFQRIHSGGGLQRQEPKRPPASCMPAASYEPRIGLEEPTLGRSVETSSDDKEVADAIREYWEKRNREKVSAPSPPATYVGGSHASVSDSAPLASRMPTPDVESSPRVQESSANEVYYPKPIPYGSSSGGPRAYRDFATASQADGGKVRPGLVLILIALGVLGLLGSIVVLLVFLFR